MVVSVTTTSLNNHFNNHLNNNLNNNFKNNFKNNLKNNNNLLQDNNLDIFKPICTTNNLPTFNQTMCNKFLTNSSTTDLFGNDYWIQPSWCKEINPFATVPFLFSDITFPEWMNAELGTVCESIVNNGPENGPETVLTTVFQDNTKPFGRKNNNNSTVKTGPLDKCKYIARISTIELKPISYFNHLTNQTDLFYPRYIFFGLVTGQIVSIHFNNNKLLTLLGQTPDNSTIKLMDTFGKENEGFLVTTSYNDFVTIFYGKSSLNFTMKYCNSFPKRKDFTILQIKLFSHILNDDTKEENVYLAIFYFHIIDKFYDLRIYKLNNCNLYNNNDYNNDYNNENDWLEQNYEIYPPWYYSDYNFNTNNKENNYKNTNKEQEQYLMVNFNIFRQVGNFSDTLTIDSAYSSRTLLLIYCYNQVRIIEFVPTTINKYNNYKDYNKIDYNNKETYIIDFDDNLFNNSTFYFAQKGEIITAANIMGEHLRRINMNTSYCENIDANQSQSLYLLLTINYKNNTILKIISLPEFENYNFFNDLNRNLFNPTNRNLIMDHCDIEFGFYFNIKTNQCEKYYEYSFSLFKEITKIRQIKTRFMNLPEEYNKYLPLLLSTTLDAQDFCNLISFNNPTLFKTCISMYNTTHCGLDLLKNLGGNILENILKTNWMHQIYISTSDRKVLVFGLQQKLCTQQQVVLEKFNEINFIGDIEDLDLSLNGQHMFVTISRERWELQSIKRYEEICKELINNPDDPFLKPFSFQCKEQPARPIDLNQYGQYTSNCFSGIYCGSLNSVKIEKVPNGKFTLRPNAVNNCEKNYFCINGVKTKCPIGFSCPYEGMVKPIPCSSDKLLLSSLSSSFGSVPDVGMGYSSKIKDNNERNSWSPYVLNSTCYGEGLNEGINCPDGTLCIAPYFPPLPVSPGYFVDNYKNIKECKIGEYCNLGRFIENDLNLTSLECPEQTYCTSPYVMEPELCIPNASQSLYCPPGSTTRHVCPAGFYCLSPKEIAECRRTQYCPNGTFVPLPCEAGFYCPTPAESILCPEGYYCPAGSVVPTPCPLVSICPAGSKSLSKNFVGLLIVVSLIIVIFITYRIYLIIKQCWKVKMDKKREKYYIQRPQSLPNHFLFEQTILIEDDLMSDTNTTFTTGTVGSEIININYGSVNNVNVTINGNNNTSPSLSSKLTIGEAMAEFYKPIKVDIEFEELALRLKTGSRKKVLNNVTGRIEGGKLTAIMGPSGCGKTTLMNVLSGRAQSYGDLTGTIKINSVPAKLQDFKKVSAFVPQEDIMLRTMTVEEIIMFHARTRLDYKIKLPRIERMVNDIIQLLDLYEVRDSIIGDEKVRGISGGQRKRVNIAMELVSAPYVLFLDEPTSGLDSFASQEVCKAMRDIAESAITVVAVIHQPRFEIFEMFHNVILLGKGGQVVYQGSTDKALNYFKDVLGLQCPPHINPSDFFIDVISDPNTAFEKYFHPSPLLELTITTTNNDINNNNISDNNNLQQQQQEEEVLINTTNVKEEEKEVTNLQQKEEKEFQQLTKLLINKIKNIDSHHHHQQQQNNNHYNNH
ncbi:hypothetical protein ABK040_006162 [Willaertia magna]